MKFLYKCIVFIYICTLNPSCTHHYNTTIKSAIIGDQYLERAHSLNFVVLGDWGRNGEFKQKEVANQMAIEAAKISASFVLSMGDNFYPDGVISTTDQQWHNSFEDIYTANSLSIPWFTAFGNHDYRGSIQAQLDYSKVSRRWRTEKRYYSFERTIPKSTEKVLFVCIDTNPFDSTLSRGSHSDLAQQNTAEQLLWLENTLAKTTAKWKIVYGHHPLFTTGVRRGKMLDVKTTFLPIFEKYKVNTYFAGHEHDLQHQKPNGYTNYFVSGAGSDIRPVTFDSLQTKFATSDHGFMSVQLQKDTMHVNVINYVGKKLYQTKIIK